VKTKIFLYLTLLLLSAPIFLFSQEEENYLIRPQYQPLSDKHRNTIDAQGRKQGLWKYYTQDKTLYYEVTFVNDIKQGPCTRYSTAFGTIIEESNYKNGKRDGFYRRYNVKSTLISEGQYINKRKSGKWFTYHPVNGEKKSEGDYIEGKREGLWVYYNSKGKMTAQGEYKAGLREGEWTYYNSNGSVAETITYVKGMLPEEIKPVKQKEKVLKGFVMTPKKKKDNTQSEQNPNP
jgi:antitoxin component YwqK of YwqJK toxin-antitoxin module